MRTGWSWIAGLTVWLCLLSDGTAAEEMQPLDVTIDSVKRTALVRAPHSAKTNDTPLVFVFHGHGGSARQAARSFALERHWPEAILVYPQGLPTRGQLTDPAGNRAGWQAAVGSEGDRDLKFFDALLSRLKQDYRVDAKRIYATGHSNGGGFTYLLWLSRGDLFAAVAPSSAVARYVTQLKPKPALHIAGENDALVKYSWQERMMEAVRKVNGCDTTGKPWHELGTLYGSKSGTPTVTVIHSGGHELYRQAPELIVEFFKEHPAK
jgi:polyhydroxybutyrate depolymerase